MTRRPELLVIAVLAGVAAGRVSTPTPTRAAFYDAMTRVCRIAAAAFGAAGMRAELAARETRDRISRPETADREARP